MKPLRQQSSAFFESMLDQESGFGLSFADVEADARRLDRIHESLHGLAPADQDVDQQNAA